MNSISAPFLSIVVPIFNEAKAVPVLYEAIKNALSSLESWEIICVDDGSSDDTLKQLERIHATDPRVKIISLSRNFGKEAALTAGFQFASGKAVIPMDADLQDPPELILRMVEKWKEGYKVVLAARRSRSSDNWFRRAAAKLFYFGMQKLCAVPIPADVGDFRLMDRQVVQVLLLLPERTRFMKGLLAWVGFTAAYVYYDRPARKHGSPTQSFLKLWRLAKDGFFSFTTLPLRITTYIGALISLCAFAYAFWLIWRTVVYGVDVPGYTSLMAVCLCLGGVQLVCLGVMGEYIGRIYRETKQRPIFIVEKNIGFSCEEKQK